LARTFLVYIGGFKLPTQIVIQIQFNRPVYAASEYLFTGGALAFPGVKPGGHIYKKYPD